MGQKTSPKGFRLVLRKDWRSVWFAGKQQYGKLVSEDEKLRSYLTKKILLPRSLRVHHQAHERQN